MPPLGDPTLPVRISRLRRLAVACVVAAAAAVGAAVLGSAGPADADITSRIAASEDRAEALRAAVREQSRRIRANARGLAAAKARLSALQTDYARRRAQLEAVQADLRRARIRLTRLERRVHRSTDALRANLVAAYTNPQPDVVTVVMSARGFTDLLESADFLKRVSRQNARIMDAAKASREAVTRQANALVRIQRRQRRLTVALQRRRDSAQVLQTALVRERAIRLAGRASKASELRRVQDRLSSLRRRLARASAPTANGAIPTNFGGTASAPAGAPAAVARVIAAGNAIAGLPYVYGGGHGSFRANAYDCSGSISYALAAAGLVSSPLNSTGFMSWGQSGPGRWITVYANPGHAFLVVGEWRFDTTALRSGGTRWTRSMRPTGGFAARHPPGL